MASSSFHYFPASPQDRAWGFYATSFGRVRVPPRAAYPPGGHPDSHRFDWSQGRTLRDYQLLYIHEGSGSFESSLGRERKITGGMAFLLFPGIWHRYRPEPTTGWRESWIELNGPYLDQLRSTGILDPHNPVYGRQDAGQVESLWRTADRLVRTKPSGFSVRLALLALQILTCLRTSFNRRPAAPRRIEHLVSQSQALLAENLQKGLSAEQIARQLGVGYSYFRREFKQQTGFSPKQYQMEIRHRSTKDMLLGSHLTITEISEQLG